MRFALTARTRDDDVVAVAWSNDPEVLAGRQASRSSEGDDEDPEPFHLDGSPLLVARAKRMVMLQREVGRDVGAPTPADLTTPHVAYLVLLQVVREYGNTLGPIDFAGRDDDGLPMDFMPMPEANHLGG